MTLSVQDVLRHVLLTVVADALEDVLVVQVLVLQVVMLDVNLHAQAVAQTASVLAQMDAELHVRLLQALYQARIALDVTQHVQPIVKDFALRLAPLDAQLHVVLNAVQHVELHALVTVPKDVMVRVQHLAQPLAPTHVLQHVLDAA